MSRRGGPYFVQARGSPEGEGIELHFATVWETVADACAHDDAVVQADRRLTYRQLDDQAARFAGALTAAGFGHDTKVSLYLYNSPEYLVADRPARATVDERIFDEHGDEQPLQIPRRHGGTWMRSTMNAVSGHGRAAVGAADRDAGGVVSHRGCG